MTVALSFIAFLGKRYIATENEKQTNEGREGNFIQTR